MKNKVPLNILPSILNIKKASYINKHPLYDISSKLSLYIHFPFCMNSCLFCPIQTVRYDPSLVEIYIKSLKKEIAGCFKMIGRHRVDNIHFGGGTPSLIKEKEIEGILNIIRDYADIENAEILLEAHPKFISNSMIDYLSGLRNCTINFGIQSLNDEILSSMKRQCSGIEILRKIDFAKKRVGTIGIDYISGWPTSNYKIITEDIKYIESMEPDHISQYPLYLTSCLENLYLHNNGEKFKIKTAQLSQYCENRFSSLGYHRYAIFYYQKKGFSHKYGRNQLDGGKWIGFGASAYSYIGDAVYVNSNIPEYIKGNFISNQYNFDHTGRLIWNIIYDFRKTDLNKNNFIRKYGKLIEHPMDEIIKIFLEKQYIASEKDISLTWNGIVNIMDVEEIINNIFEPKEPNKQ